MDGEEYTRIVETYMDTIYRVAISCAKTIPDAEDVVQNTFMKLLAKEKKFNDDEHIKRWLIRVAVNECTNLWSSFWRRNVDSMDSMTVEPEDGGFDVSVSSELYEAVQGLSPKLRIVVHLFYYEGYSTREMAELLRLRETTVRTRLVRARKLLREQLKEAWEDEE